MDVRRTVFLYTEFMAHVWIMGTSLASILSCACASAFRNELSNNTIPGSVQKS